MVGILDNVKQPCHPEYGVAMSSSRPVVAVCAGKSCRRRSETTDLVRALDRSIATVKLPCIGVCDGPVVALRSSSGNEVVVSKVRSPKARQDLLSAVAGKSVSDRLRRRSVGPKARKKALKRIG